MINCIKFFFSINKNSTCKFLVVKTTLNIFSKSDDITLSKKFYENQTVYSRLLFKFKKVELFGYILMSQYFVQVGKKRH